MQPQGMSMIIATRMIHRAILVHIAPLHVIEQTGGDCARAITAPHSVSLLTRLSAEK